MRERQCLCGFREPRLRSVADSSAQRVMLAIESISMGLGGSKDREQRLTQWRSGSWGTVSQDLLHLVAKLFRLSKAEAESSEDRNSSRFVYAGIPLLVSALRSFIIEYESIGSLIPPPAELNDPLVKLLADRYGAGAGLLADLEYLSEIRNEILHPVPLPSGTPDNWPEYLRRLKEKGLLTSSGCADADYIMLGQIASHRLFDWAVEVTRRSYEAVVEHDPSRGAHFQGFLWSFTTLFR